MSLLNRRFGRQTTTATTPAHIHSTCIVTGSSSGLGRAIALLFAREGARLVACADLSANAKSTFQAEEAGTPTHELICQRYGERKSFFKRCDVTHARDVETLVQETVKRSAFGEQEPNDYNSVGYDSMRLDVIVNNAGIGGTEGHGQVHEMTEETWDTTMAANSKGAFLGCKYAIQQFLRQAPNPAIAGSRGTKGWIINTSSIMGLVGQKVNGAAYCASKGAVMLLTKSTAVAYAKDKIVCNALCPGHLKTPMTEGQYKDEEMRRQISSLYPDPEDWGTAEDVARVAVFLASEDAGFVTGVGLPVDGGYCAQ
ncbi:uncharacterized protein KY384_005079 [Bacidia gigantensis]|uniref:uncharacterized protein n=1 Tax=Bacidia gigantensis TaxID=2732470 RepID=UPI001D0465C7|nr:uncharacterized protein KY384_005079 [Bacidia gigantensis]KAG8530576.1 hypothetical protein KY384_005079 [Bacidia gigantensis]